MKILITICGRGGSKGIPAKNIKPINGKPLIAYTIEVAKKFADKYPADLTLSTDSDDIRKTASDYGLLTSYKRPEWLASDAAGKIDTIRDLLHFEEQNNNVKYDYILDLDITSPLRTIQDLDEAFSMIASDVLAINLFSVNPAARNPYFNMVEQQENGYYGLIKKGKFLTRQSAPTVYDLNASFYFYKRSFFEENHTSVMTCNALIFVMKHICFDLDHPVDFEFMEYLMVNNKLEFDL